MQDKEGMQILLLGENERNSHPHISDLCNAPEVLQSDSVYERMYAEQSRKHVERAARLAEARGEHDNRDQGSIHNREEEDKEEDSGTASGSQEEESKDESTKRAFLFLLHTA